MCRFQRSLAAEPCRKVLEPRLLRRRARKSFRKERLGQPTRPQAQLVPPRVGDARGLITLNPKLLDIRVVKGGSRQLGSAE